MTPKAQIKYNPIELVYDNIMTFKLDMITH